MKKLIIIFIAVLSASLIGGCSYLEDLGIIDEQSDIIPDDFNQQEIFDDMKDGMSQVYDLVKDSDFTLEDLSEMDILDGENPLESLAEFMDKDNDFSITDLDINSLNLENLSDEQISLITQVISGDMTMTELIASGEFTLKDLQDMGLFQVISDNTGKDDSEN